MIGYLTRNHLLIGALTPAVERRTRPEARESQRVLRHAPRLGEVVAGEDLVAVRGPLDRPIAGLATDPRRVLPGFVYFADSGGGVDGLRHVDEAVRRGAVAVVAPRLPRHGPGRASLLQVASVPATLARAAQRFYGFPDRELALVAVTGGAGRTSVAHLLQKLLGGDGAVGLLSATHYHLGRRSVPAFGVAPDALDLIGMLAQMRDAGCRQAVLEIDELDWAAGRVPELRLRAVVSCDRDGPAGGEEALESGGVTVVAAGAAEGEAGGGRRRESAGEAGRLVTYGEGPAAQVRAESVVLGAEETRFRLVWPGGQRDVRSPLIGRDHVRHVLAAFATAWALGRDPGVAGATLRSFAGVPGCRERLRIDRPFAVVVDGAGEPESLARTLEELRQVTAGRLLVVFGCEGNRDSSRRAEIVRTVQAGADLAIATADNPRAEPLAGIFEDMRAGVTAPGRIVWLEDRRRAIACALDLARLGDCVLLAGKGHAAVQELGDTVFPFDDRVVAREVLAEAARKAGG